MGYANHGRPYESPSLPEGCEQWGLLTPGQLYLIKNYSDFLEKMLLQRNLIDAQLIQKSKTYGWIGVFNKIINGAEARKLWYLGAETKGPYFSLNSNLIKNKDLLDFNLILSFVHNYHVDPSFTLTLVHCPDISKQEYLKIASQEELPVLLNRLLDKAEAFLAY